jgi:hypothetical protein
MKGKIAFISKCFCRRVEGRHGGKTPFIPGNQMEGSGQIRAAAALPKGKVIQHASGGSLCGLQRNLTQAFVKRFLFCREFDPFH